MFSGAQGFFLDPAVFAGASAVKVSKISLYFKSKPSATNNKSGITNPGVTIYLVPTVDRKPVLDNLATAPYARAEYANVATSSDATLKTDFVFSNLAPAITGQSWAFVIAPDGNEDFVTWKNKKGDLLVGTTTRSPGADGKFIGDYFTYISPAPVAQTAVSTSNSGIVSSVTDIETGQAANTGYATAGWRASSDTDLKFKLYVARYAFSGNTDLANAIANNGIPATAAVVAPLTTSVTFDAATGINTFRIPATRNEYLVYNRRSSRQRGNTRVGALAWQHRPYARGASVSPWTIAVSNNSARITNSSSFSFANVFSGSGADQEYIVVVSENHYGANDHAVAVGRLLSLDSNTSILIDSNVTFSNSAAYFYRTSVGIIDKYGNTRAFGVNEDILVLRDSNSNTSVRFVNNVVESINATVGGTGFSNDDYLTITGFESVTDKVVGGYAAVANITTNATGGITAITLSNSGAGFINTAAMVYTITNSTGGSPNGSGQTIVANVGMTIWTSSKTDDRIASYLRSARVVNLEVGEVAPAIEKVINPIGTFYNMLHRLAYFVEDDNAVYGGKAYYLDANNDDNDVYPVKPGYSTKKRYKKRRITPSWSNELHICYSSGGQSNGVGVQANAVANTLTQPLSNASVLFVNAISNGDFSCITVPQTGDLIFSKYIINNDYTNEHTNYGNALAKGVSTKVTLANDHFAEDILAYVTAYRPAGTDIQLYVRLHNSNDPEAFDDKNWTRMQINSECANLYSSLTDSNDYVELTFGLQQNPNTAFTLQGLATTTLNQTNVVGVGTDWSTNLTQNLVAGDMVRIVNPLFPNNQMISIVASVTNNTLLTLTDAVANSGLVGPGFKVDKIAYPFQAFNYVLRDNVARYYNTSKVVFEGFNTYQFKPVLLSNSEHIVPRIDDLRAPATSS